MRDLWHPDSQNYTHSCADCGVPCYPRRCSDGAYRCDECIEFNRQEPFDTHVERWIS